MLYINLGKSISMTPEIKPLMGKICLFLLIIISIAILNTLMIRTIDRMRLV